MPVPVPQHTRLPSHQVIKPSSKGNVGAPAGHNAPQYVIQGATRQQLPTYATAEVGSQNWTDSFFASNGQARHCTRDTEEYRVIDPAAATFVALDPVDSAAGQPRFTGPRSSPVHDSVHTGDGAHSRIMTWLKNVDSLPVQASVSGQEMHRHPVPSKSLGAAEVYAEAYDSGVYSYVPLKPSVPAFEDSGFMEADVPFDNFTATVGGITPFATYIDRIATTNALNYPEPSIVEKPAPTIETPRLQKPPSPERLTDPLYIKAYQALAGSLSEWIADYVWKVCTKGMSLPPRFVGMRSGRLFPERPPTQLADSIKSVLCATLLQPSGVALALWYISRLPVFVEQQVPAGTLTSNEVEFRNELFGDGSYNGAIGDFSDRAAFKVALLGCMLANKWLDDHTFSNKTWHSVSSVPLQTINRLEFLALGILSHDLSVPPLAWEQWLVDLRSYHASSSPFPSPIRRPSSTDSNSLVKKLIDDLITLLGDSNVGSSNSDTNNVPQPVFSELLVKDEERIAVRDSVSTESFDIDLDEDGPLRAEYVPKRRSSQRSSYSSSSDHGSSRSERLDDFALAVQQSLPPPASWVPHEDPPVERQQAVRERYIPVAPIPPVGTYGRTTAVEQEQPWWVEEQNKMINIPRQDNINVAGSTWYNPQSASYGYSSRTIAPPLSFARSTHSLAQNPVAVQLRAFAYSQMECDGVSYSHCGPPAFPSAYVSSENSVPFPFRPQFLRA
ncbi:hypothetical protein SCHPADRAFT_938331 [Schizopora paradoxa]|uniref:Cyclin N-terminal domain-containing protein n=1 Tax=Schizopora paradoxa TaxID=27342 RepID=A0A0H2RVI9_9AGAM|nr:hypothetical protein SCHPADRAFT_938331 [Schizopora paradoxa]